MHTKIILDHGSGGKASHDLIQRIILSSFASSSLNDLEDSAVITVGRQRLAFSTDSFVVDPLFFPGGNIGDLAVNGTVNDLAMRGARPLFLTVGLILEEGLPIEVLQKILHAMKRSADLAKVRIVAGDTKVVPAGKCDKIFINTSGIGILEHALNISGKNARPGDQIILSGTMADHGITILCQQEGLKITGGFQSDTAAVNHLVLQLIEQEQANIHVLRDPTRGGVATTLNEIAQASAVGIELAEEALPVRGDVGGACELLGLEPLYLANEGKFLAVVHPEAAARALALMRQDQLGSQSCIIGRVTDSHPGQVVLKSGLGTTRLIDMLHGKPLPRIC